MPMNLSNKKNKNVDKLIFTSIYSLLIISAIGTMSGTFAWYEYSTRAETGFRGTAVNDAKELKMGILSDVVLSEASQYGLVKDDTHPNIYWAEEGLDSDTLSYFLRECGYASNSLFPTTSGAYTQGDDFQIKMNPSKLAPNLIDAVKENYVFLPLVFKAQGDISAATNFEVKLVDLDITSPTNLKDGVRINITNEYDSYVFAPSHRQGGEVVVGGALDLDNDGYNDDFVGKEFFYGEAETLEYSTTPAGPGEVLPKGQRTSFNGICKEGIYPIDKEKSVFKTASYYGTDDVLEKLDVAKAIDNELAFCNITVYLEGWATTTIDKEVGNAFNLDLTFELYND